MSTFKVASRFLKTAKLVNERVPAEKFPLILNRILQKLHLKDAQFFSVPEQDQLMDMFELGKEQLQQILSCCAYIFEQAAFTSTGPEALYDLLLDAGFDEPHAKALGRAWAADASEYVAKLKNQTLGYQTLEGVEYHLNMVLGQSALTKQQEPTALFELSVGSSSNGAADPAGGTGNAVTAQEKFCVEFSHDELFSFFADIERLQQQIDSLGAT